MSEQDYFKKDYYKVLGVDKNATDTEIKKAFRKLSRQYHPDQNKGNAAAEKKYKEITEANTVLGNKKEREKYDQIRAMAGGAHFTGGSAGGFEDLFGGFGGQNVRYSTSGGGSPFGGGGGFSDIFSSLFGGGGSSGGFAGAGNDPFGGGYGSPYSQGSTAHNSPTHSKPAVDKTYKIKVVNAMFGAKLKHKFKDGSEVVFKVPAGVQSGKILSIKGPSGKSERIKIEVTIPDASKLDEKKAKELKDLLKEL